MRLPQPTVTARTLGQRASTGHIGCADQSDSEDLQFAVTGKCARDQLAVMGKFARSQSAAARASRASLDP
eukprot:364378-Chlamydomonas_euryale.AAC.14